MTGRRHPPDCRHCEVARRLRPKSAASILARFLAKVAPREGQCTLWIAGADDKGYGVFWDGSRYVGAHRWAWSQRHGPIPAGLSVLHRCDTPLCVKTEPDERWPDGHLFLGTTAVNQADMAAKGRSTHGSRHHSARLRETDIPVIRARAAGGESHVALGRVYGVSGVSIDRIVSRRNWAHVS